MVFYMIALVDNRTVIRCTAWEVSEDLPASTLIIEGRHLIDVVDLQARIPEEGITKPGKDLQMMWLPMHQIASISEFKGKVEEKKEAPQ